MERTISFGARQKWSISIRRAGTGRYLSESISRFLAEPKAGIIAVSAGFDRHEHDWGGLLTTEDYETIGRLVKEFAQKTCRSRRYGVLEGGYNHDVLGGNVVALLNGMD